MPFTDQELIEQYRAGDDESFTLLVQRYLTPIYRFAFQFTHEQSNTEDIVQETFIKVWKNLHRFDPGRPFKTWVFAIAKNTTYDFLKKKKTLPFSAFENDEGENPLEAIDDENLLPDSLLERKEAATLLAGALKKLSPNNRTLLTLKYLEDFSLEEISEILKEPYNTIKSRHSRALQSLKKAILSDNASDETMRAY